MIKKNIRDRLNTSIVLLFLLVLMINSNFISTYLLIILGVLSLLEFLKLSERIFLKQFLKYIFNIFFIFYLIFFCFLFFYFSNFLQLKILLYTFVFGCIASDIGGFLFGKFFKGPKLTKISPNKTFSGAIGSIICTSTMIMIIVFFFINTFSYVILIVSFITSIGCQIGDLFFSYLKRKAKIKDTGNILPGHGGILDRIDGILVGVPISFISLILISQ